MRTRADRVAFHLRWKSQRDEKRKLERVDSTRREWCLLTTNQLPAEALPMTLNGFAQPGLGFGLGVSVRLDTKLSKPDPAAGEYGWSGAASTYFWVAPRTELMVIVLQQIQPFNFGLQLALKPAIYS